MKKQQMMKALVILGLILLGSFKSSYAQDTEVRIILPYTGKFNEWNIKFKDGTNTYTFETNNETFESGVLGTLPEGTYTVTFSSPYFSYENFDILVYTSDPNVYSRGITQSTDLTLYRVVVDHDTFVQIDAGY